LAARPRGEGHIGGFADPIVDNVAMASSLRSFE